MNKFNFTFVLILKFNIMAAAALIPLAVGAGMNLYNMYQANSRANQAQGDADRLAKVPLSKYTPNSRLTGFYNQAVNDVANPQGYTSSERGRFGNRLSQILNTQRANAENLGGGGVSRAIGAIGNASSINALNDFSANDSNLSRQFRNSGLSRMDSSIRQLQSLDNMNTQVELQRRMMQEQALGNAIRSNRDTVSNGINNLGSDLMGFGLTKMLPTGGAGNVEGVGTTGKTTRGIRNPNIFSSGKMFSGNRFSNFVDNYATDANVIDEETITNDMAFTPRVNNSRVNRFLYN